MGLMVDIRRLSFAYPGAPLVLHDVELSVDASETVAICGPNGAGKSTLLLHLNGLLPAKLAGPEMPQVTVDGLAVRPEHLAEIRRRVGFVFQDPDDQLFCSTLYEDVRFGPAHLNLPEKEVRNRVLEAIETVGLAGLEERSPHQLSLGQRKRACLAGVLACQPKLLVLDEPTSHLDPRGRREFIALLSRLDCPKVLATHDLEFVLEVASRVVIMDGGRVFADGRPEEILADSALMERHGLEVPASLMIETDSHREVAKRLGRS